MVDRSVYIRTGLRFALLVGIGVTAALALSPNLRLPPLLHLGGYSDIVYHFVGFFVLTATAILATQKIVPPIVWMVVLATLLECLQSFVPGREVFLSDLVAGLAGVVSGAVLVTLVTSAGPRSTRPVRLV